MSITHRAIKPFLKCKDLTVEFDGARVLDCVSLDLIPGRITAIVGESGSGKSQLVKAFTGLSKGKVSGSVEFNGAEFIGATEARMLAVRGREIAYVFQDPMSALNPYFRVGKQLVEVARVHLGLSKKNARIRALDMLRKVRMPDPERHLDAFPHELSGGQRQRVVIAMSLMAEPGLLIADEPTTALDVTVQLKILELVRELCDHDGLSCAFITHDIAVAAHIAEDIIVIENGRIVETGLTRDVLIAPRHPYTRTLITNTPKLTGPIDRKAHRGTDPLLQVEGLEVRYPGGGLFTRHEEFRAVSDVSFDLRRGETLGIVGESGSGKSSIARALLRLAPVAGGRIKWRGQPVQDLDDRAFRSLRRDMQIVFQDPYSSLNPRMRARDLVAEPLWTHFPEYSETKVAGRVRDALFAVGLGDEMLSRYPHELSGGQAQRICIARAIVSEPALLICDEAVSALDVTVQAKVIELINSLQKQLDLGIIFISHDLAVVRQVADRIIVLNKGELCESADRDVLFEHPSHAYTRELLRSVLSLEH